MNNSDNSTFYGTNNLSLSTYFYTSDMASYVSGELMAVNMGGHIEETAGIRPQVNDINLSKILAYLQSMKN